MLNYDNFAITLARAVDSLRSRPDAVEEHKGALRALVALTKLGGAKISFQGNGLVVEGVPVAQTLPLIPVLSARMKARSIREIRIERGASAGDLLSLVRTLATDSGGSDGPGVETTGTVAVISVPEEEVPEGHRPGSVTRAFEVLGLGDHDDEEGEERDTPVPPVKRRAAPASASDHALASALENLAANPHGAGLRDRLGTVVDGIGAAASAGDAGAAAKALAIVLDHEERSPSEGDARQMYDSAVRHVLSQDLLDGIVPLVTDPQLAPVVSRVIKRAGLDGVDAVVASLVAAESPGEARAYFDALEGVRDRGRLLVALLTHPEPSTVRNVAELMGELGFAEAVPALGRTLSHDEPLVREAAAIALAKIATPSTVEFVKRVLKESDEPMRMSVARHIGGAHAEALVRPLEQAAARESDSDVRVEYYRALGRIGTQGAMHALIKAVQPGGRLIGRKPASVRIDAIAGLRFANSPAVRGTLEGLVSDQDPDVREAAREALDEVKWNRPSAELSGE